MAWDTIIKSRRDWAVIPHLHDYTAVRATFSWDKASLELDGLPHGQGLNIAHEAVVRHAEGPRRDHLAMRWLGKHGETLDFSYGRLEEQTNRFSVQSSCASAIVEGGMKTASLVPSRSSSLSAQPYPRPAASSFVNTQ